MVCLSRSLHVIVKRGGEAVWKEMTCKKLPKDLQNATSNRMPMYFLGGPTIVAVIGYFLVIQYEYNSKSWLGKKLNQIVDNFLDPSKPDTLTSMKNNAMAKYNEIIATEKAMQREATTEKREPTEEELAKIWEDTMEEQRKEGLNKYMNKKYSDTEMKLRY